jgi:hypothetical protein
MIDTREVILVFLFVWISCAVAQSDVEVFNKNYDRTHRNARNLVYRVFEVIPPRVILYL